MRESRLSLTARVVVGILLLCESLFMLLLGGFAVMVGGLVSMLAFAGGGAAGATDAQLAQTFGLVVITLASPFVMCAVVGLAGLLILIGRGKAVVIAAGIFAILVQIGAHPFFREGFHAWELVPAALHVVAIVVAYAFMPVLRYPASVASVPSGA